MIKGKDGDMPSGAHHIINAACPQGEGGQNSKFGCVFFIIMTQSNGIMQSKQKEDRLYV
jgi:hypothetical protein